MLPELIARFHQAWGAGRFSERPGANEGQGLVEYALILMFVAVVMIVLVVMFGPGLGNIYSNIVANF